MRNAKQGNDLKGQGERERGRGTMGKGERGKWAG